MLERARMRLLSAVAATTRSTEHLLDLALHRDDHLAKVGARTFEVRQHARALEVRLSELTR